MLLPNAASVIVERQKVVNYRLNQTHHFGASKARFFRGFGFCVESWEELADALKAHGAAHEVVRLTKTGFGPRYEVEGELWTPDGRHPRIRTVWQIDDGRVAPRLITAYPL